MSKETLQAGHLKCVPSTCSSTRRVFCGPHAGQWCPSDEVQAGASMSMYVRVIVSVPFLTQGFLSFAQGNFSRTRSQTCPRPIGGIQIPQRWLSRAFEPGAQVSEVQSHRPKIGADHGQVDFPLISGKDERSFYPFFCPNLAVSAFTDIFPSLLRNEPLKLFSRKRAKGRHEGATLAY